MNIEAIRSSENVGSHKIYTTPHPRRRHSTREMFFPRTKSFSPEMISLYLVPEKRAFHFPFSAHSGSEKN
jgi:hypothetical protein